MQPRKRTWQGRDQNPMQSVAARMNQERPEFIRWGRGTGLVSNEMG